MWVMLFAVVIGILVVNGIKNRAVDHSWKIASATGSSSLCDRRRIGKYLFGTSYALYDDDFQWNSWCCSRIVP